MAELPYSLPTTLPGDGVTPLPPGTTTPTGGGSGTLTAIADLCGQSLDLLLRQYEDSPRLQALVCLMIDRVQEIDDAAAAIYTSVLDVNNAEGVHLDLLGRIVRESRNGASDVLYRRGILARVLINRSQGRIRDLAQIVRVFAGLTDADTVRIQEIQPARIRVDVDGALIVPSAEILRRLRRAKAAGVALQLVTLAPGVPTDRAFRLGAAADAPEANTTQGLAWTGSGTVGGYLNHVSA